MPNFRGNEDLCKLGKKYLNDLLCKFGPFCLQRFKTFDISHAFLQVTLAELSTLKQVRFFWLTLYLLSEASLSIVVKGLHIALYWKPVTELRSTTCRMGSCSATCHSTQVNELCHNPSQTGRYPGWMKGWVDHSGWFNCPQTATHPSTTIWLWPEWK